jgi:hypothetical protein
VGGFAGVRLGYGGGVSTKAERLHLDRVASLGCIVCYLLDDGYKAAQVHHIREGQGMGERAGNFLTIPLCPDHHTGPQGVHGDRTYMRILKVDELDLLNITLERLERG